MSSTERRWNVDDGFDGSKLELFRKFSGKEHAFPAVSKCEAADSALARNKVSDMHLDFAPSVEVNPCHMHLSEPLSASNESG